MSLLSIYSLTAVLYALFFIVIPSLIVLEVNHYWRDDIMIIGLALFSFVIWVHSHEDIEELVSSDNTKKETTDAVELAGAEVIK
jgi:hypothetical protein